MAIGHDSMTLASAVQGFEDFPNKSLSPALETSYQQLSELFNSQFVN
jgi:hypothetical protein